MVKTLFEIKHSQNCKGKSLEKYDKPIGDSYQELMLVEEDQAGVRIMDK